MPRFYVKALWDVETEIYYSETNIPGLVVEAPTPAEFQALVANLAPEMLQDNAGIHAETVKISLSFERDLTLAVA